MTATIRNGVGLRSHDGIVFKYGNSFVGAPLIPGVLPNGYAVILSKAELTRTGTAKKSGDQ